MAKRLHELYLLASNSSLPWGLDRKLLDCEELASVFFHLFGDYAINAFSSRAQWEKLCFNIAKLQAHHRLCDWFTGMIMKPLKKRTNLGIVA